MDGLQEGAEIGEEGATQQGGPQQQAAQAQQVTGGGAGAGAPEGGPAENARDDYEAATLGSRSWRGRSPRRPRRPRARRG